MIRPNDVLVLESGGGGGWGDPAEREGAARAQDVENEFVTPACGDADKSLLGAVGEGVPATTLQPHSLPRKRPQAGEG